MIILTIMEWCAGGRGRRVAGEGPRSGRSRPPPLDYDETAALKGSNLPDAVGSGRAASAKCVHAPSWSCDLACWPPQPQLS